MNRLYSDAFSIISLTMFGNLFAVAYSPNSIVTDGLYDSSDSDISMKQVDLTNVENFLYEMKC
jgi:hypothetical protein